MSAIAFKEMTPSELYYNCLYSAVAHAINNLNAPFFAYEQSWDNDNYNYHYGSGRGTISFDLKRNIVAGAAREEDSVRIKWYPEYNAIDLFKCRSEYLEQLAISETLEYLYDSREEIIKPMATVAFWIEDNKLYISDKEEDFRLNGGEFLFIMTSMLDDLKKYWKEQYNFNEEETAAVEHIYHCIVRHMIIKKKDVKKIINRKKSGYKECLESLQEMGAVIKR